MSEDDKTAKVKEVEEAKAMERVIKECIPNTTSASERKQWSKMSSLDRANAIVECNMKEDKPDKDNPSSTIDDEDQNEKVKAAEKPTRMHILI